MSEIEFTEEVQERFKQDFNIEDMERHFLPKEEDHSEVKHDKEDTLGGCT